VTTTYQSRQPIESLAPFSVIPEWLAGPMRPERVEASLCRHVPELNDGRLRLLACSPDRLRAKGSDWLVRYTLSLDGTGDAPYDVVLVGNLWPPHAPYSDDGRVTSTARFGDPQWRGWLPDLRLALRTQTHDEGLPALPRLVEPAAARELLQPILNAAGHRATIAACEPVVVRYKPGSRCTVVVSMTYAGGESSDPPPAKVVVKTHQGDKGAAAWAAMTALWHRPDTWQESVRLAEPLGYLPDERILVQGPIPEDRTLKELAREALGTADPASLDRLRTELAATARALAAVHTSGATYGRTATLEDELAEVGEVVDRLALSVPPLAAAARPLLDALAARAREIPSDPLVAAHHDFRPAQVLLHDGGVGFIDFDGAAMAEPALDLGRFRAKLRDIGISAVSQAGPDPTGPSVEECLALLDDLCEDFLDVYRQHAPVSRERILVWEACDLLTSMLHAWTKVRLARLEPRMTTLVHHLRSSGVLTPA
jgi:Phosphotransferase enzyme family